MQIIKKKLRFIVNPISGVGKQRIVEDLLYRFLDHHLFDYEICYTKAPRHAIDLSREAALFNYYAVVAVGGDGSVNEVAQGLLNSTTLLAILPCGSGNGLARNLKIPLDLTEAIKKINTHSIKNLDAGKFGSRYFFNVCGIGFDGHVSNVFSKNKKRGFSTYIKVVIKEVFNYKKIISSFSNNNTVFPAARILNSICIGTQYGNNFYISPNSKVDDGMFELVMIDRLIWYKLPALVYYAFSNQINISSLVKIQSYTTLHISGHNLECHVDGEPFVLNDCSIDITIEEKALKIMV
jgi:diacylglycerol kinase family enzyme